MDVEEAINHRYGVRVPEVQQQQWTMATTSGGGGGGGRTRGEGRVERSGMVGDILRNSPLRQASSADQRRREPRPSFDSPRFAPFLLICPPAKFRG